MIKRESVGIWLRLSHNAAICSLCAILLPLPQQLSGKNIRLVFSKSWAWIPAGHLGVGNK